MDRVGEVQSTLHSRGLMSAVRRVLLSAVTVLVAGGLCAAVAVAAAQSGSEGAGDAQSDVQTKTGASDLCPKPQAGAPSELEVDCIVVIGSYLPQTPGSVPVRIIDEDQIRQLGASNLADVLQYEPAESISFTPLTNFGASQGIRLRGLGPSATLVMLNSLRVNPSALQVGGGNFADVSLIPLSAVERIEVLPDSASALYGTDAVGGVVNIVTRKQIARPVVDVSYGAADGGAEEKRGALSFGLNGEVLRAAVVIDGFKRDVLPGTERSLFADRNYTRFGSTDQRLPFSNPANISSLTAANLPGLNSRTAAVPVGSSGVGLQPTDLLPEQTNLASFGIYSSVIPESKRNSLFSSFEYDLAPNLQLAAEVLYVDGSNTRLLTPSLLAGAKVSAQNPFNPFGVDVAVNYLFAGVGSQRDETDSDVLRTRLSAAGDLALWHWELNALRSDEDGSNRKFGVVDQTRVAAALASTDPNTALNVFQDGPGGSPQLLASLVPDPRRDNYESTGLLFNALLRGPTVSLPAGALEVALGAETRSDEILLDTATIRVAKDRRINSAFSEVRIPLVNSDMDIALVHGLTLTGAVRYDDYTDFGQTVNPQAGLQWRMLQSLSWRVSYGQSFRAPSLFEINQPTTPVQLTILDPQRGNALSAYTLTTGGNTTLDPEESHSLTAGFVVSPEALPDFKLELSYGTIHQDQRILVLTPNQILANPALFPGRIVRDANGVLISIDATRTNFGVADLSYIDAAVEHVFRTRFGEFSPRLLATYFTRYDVADVPGAPVVDRIGMANTQGTITRWRGTGTLAWNLRGIGLVLTTRYTPAYDDANPANIGNGKRVEARAILDLQASLDFERLFPSSRALQGLVMRGGAINLTNEEPAFTELSGIGYDQSQADVRQRYVYFGVSKRL
jgi:iron complex outermembrane recepter protein